MCLSLNFKDTNKRNGQRGRNWLNDCPLAFVLLGRGNTGPPQTELQCSLKEAKKQYKGFINSRDSPESQD